MKRLFERSDLCLLNYYLGIEVKQDSFAISLSQSGMLWRYWRSSAGLSESNPCQVPMEPRLKLSKVIDNPPVDATLYHSVIGSLRYLVNTWPDLSYTVSVVSRYMEAPTTTHIAAVKQILRYVRGTINHGCCYEKKTKVGKKLIGYNDSDLVGDVDDRESTTGIIYFLDRRPVTWIL